MNFQTFTLGIPLFAIALGVTGGCGDDEGGTYEICTWVKDPGECPDTTSGSTDDGGDDGEGADSPACSLSNNTVPRTVFQCNGTLAVSIAFDTILGDCGKTLGDPGWCDESHDFGAGFDPHEMPAVMACCDASGVSPSELLTYCAADLVEQLCMSLPKRLQMLIDEGVINIGKNQARALRDWLNSHPQDCYNALNKHSPDVPGALEPSAWLVNGGDSKDWSMLKNFTITVDEAQVFGVTLPEHGADGGVCYDNRFNNTEIFEEVIPVSPGINDISHLTEARYAEIMGPTIADRRVHGSARIAAHGEVCRYRCSSIEITDDQSGLWTLEDMSLYADAGGVQIDHGELSFGIERAALRLFGVSHGVSKSGRYVIEPGDAHFLVSGASADASDVRWTSNVTPISAHRSGSGWAIGPFTVTHVDGSGQRWDVTIPATTWE